MLPIFYIAKYMRSHGSVLQKICFVSYDQNTWNNIFKELEFVKSYWKLTRTWIFFKDFYQKFIVQPNRIAVLRAHILEKAVEQCLLLFLKSVHCPTKQINDNYQIVQYLFYQLLVYVKIIKKLLVLLRQRQILNLLQYTRLFPVLQRQQFSFFLLNSGQWWTSS